MRHQALQFLIVISLHFLFLSSSLAQPLITKKRNVEVPVYRSMQDSIRLANVDAVLQAISSHEPVDIKVLDSIMALKQTIYQESVLRLRTIYKPSEDFIPFDSIHSRKDIHTLKKVSIASRKLNTLPEELLQCDSLESLEIVNCSIRKIQKQINNLPRLTSITILNNKSKRPLKLSKNIHVTSFTIHGDRPNALPRSYRKFKALTMLDLSNNVLTKFPNGAAHNTKLDELSLQHNEITLVRDKLKSHPNLQKLALQQNNIYRIPASIAQFPNLTRLSLNHNKITEVAPEISTLKKLEHLSFYNNQLTSVPWGVYQLRSLKVIDLYFNQIDTISNLISNWTSLEILFVAHNKLLVLPEKLTAIASLQEIYAYDNRLTRIAEDIDRLSNLRIMLVNNNCLKQIPLSLLNLGGIEELDFSENYMTDLPEGIFDFKNLKFISLMNNPWNERTRILIDKKSRALADKDITIRVSGPSYTFQ
ncbi:leucine-rich repeat domain-containing protein [Ohtaekwangia koreensis]|uniref:Leucine-rich repeat (LRR) protein n=1 Tax=Ohtaekwangia koreensis TaxID=688867 RepID=A0A1T5M3C3_9BACT|nr:leucine-rich repeat domain-containing protein [Ohtaekwangia koreensis]SKC82625.1 Leucine-rich repeat (LRR) protein [Ohtaekwangia koreensis]